MLEIDKVDYAELQAVAAKAAQTAADLVAQEQKTWDGAQKAREIATRLAELDSQVDKEDADRVKKISDAAKELKTATDAADKARAAYDVVSPKTDQVSFDALQQKVNDAPAALAAARKNLDAATKAVEDADSVAKTARETLVTVTKDYKDSETAAKALPEALAKARQVFEKADKDKDVDATREAKRSLDEATAELAKATAQHDFRKATAECDFMHAVAEIRGKQAELARTREVAPPHRP
jgi:chromosome segregation ATPase